jgi:hypothetical protein
MLETELVATVFSPDMGVYGKWSKLIKYERSTTRKKMDLVLLEFDF